MSVAGSPDEFATYRKQPRRGDLVHHGTRGNSDLVFYSLSTEQSEQWRRIRGSD